MRVNFVSKYLVAAALVGGCWVTVQPAFGAKEKPAGVPNFYPGVWVLQEGTADECGTGDFAVRDGGRNVELGVLHGFDTENKTEKIDADIPELSGCVYNTKNAREVKGDQTVLSFEEVLSCGESVRHTLNERATLAKEKVIVEVSQKASPEFTADEESFSYRCVWTPAPLKEKRSSAKKK